MISQITNNIYLAGAVDLLHINEILKHKITAFLNVAFDLELPPQARFFLNHMEYVKVGLIDGEGNNINMLEAARLSLKGLLMKHRKVMVYCWGGISRSTAVIAYYLMVEYRISFNQAINNIAGQRSIVRVNPALSNLIQECNQVFNN